MPFDVDPIQVLFQRVPEGRCARRLWLGMRRKDFVAGSNKVSGRQYRMMNEVPTVLLLIIVASVIVKF